MKLPSEYYKMTTSELMATLSTARIMGELTDTEIAEVQALLADKAENYGQNRKGPTVIDTV